MKKSVVAMIVLAAVTITLPARADGPASAPAAIDDLLKSRNLTENGFLIVFPDEAKIHAQVRALRSDKVKIANETAARAALDRAIKDARDQLQSLYAQSQSLNDRLASSAKNAAQNQLVGQVNSVIDRIKLQEANVEDLKDRQSKLPDSRTDYITLALDLPGKAQDLAAGYQALAKDDELTSAIAAHNKTAGLKLRLGPSGIFQADAAFLKQIAGEVITEAVPVDSSDGVPTVEALLNGKVKETMIWDSGASIVTLTAKTADDLGLHPTKKDPTLQLKVADGRTVNAKLMHLDSVRVGAFTASDVECVIMPRGVKGIGDLLGDTFQRHFLCRMDLQASELHLTPLDAQPAIAKAKPATRP